MNNVPRKYYGVEIVTENVNLWQKLLAFGLERADTIEFVVASNENDWNSMLTSFSTFLVEQFSSHWRWQNRQIYRTTFARFRLNDEVKRNVLSIPKLEDWLFPQPEDPTLYTDDTAILWTISHANMVFVLLTDDEVQQLQLDDCALTMNVDLAPPTRKELD